MQKRVLAFTLAISLSHTGFANADQFECQEAIGRYSRATKEISEYLRIYTNCVWSSRGRNDCSSEFSSLEDAQHDFEKAVSRYRKECVIG
jgi:hypothetical protein